MRRYEITDQQWQRLAHLLPGKAGDVGRSAIDNRLLINRTGEPAILWIARSGHPGATYPNELVLGIRPIAGFAVGLSQVSGKMSLTNCRSLTWTG